MNWIATNGGIACLLILQKRGVKGEDEEYTKPVVYPPPYSNNLPIPYIFRKPVPLLQVVEEFWDLSCIPKKYVFSVLAHFSEDKLEKGKCLEFCSPEGQEDLLNYCNRLRRTILEVLEDFPHSTSKLTLASLFEIFTPIKPRSFSIANSCLAANNKELEILVAVVSYKTKLKAERKGLCSNWLKDLSEGSKVYGWIKKGTFNFPQQDTPVIMVGPGTGLAPFRSLIMEREFLGKASNSNLILFFGCRYESADFHCGEYLKQLHADDKLNLICAFSRDQDNKVYVQHKISSQKSMLWKLISGNGACIFIAGNSKNMPDNVKDALVEDVLMSEGQMTKDEAATYFKQMESTGKIEFETW